MQLYKWFTGTTGMAIGERMKRIMSPSAPKHESEIAESIDKWNEARRNLEAIKDEYKLATPFLFFCIVESLSIFIEKLYCGLLCLYIYIYIY